MADPIAELLEQFAEARTRMLEELGKSIVGQQDVIDQILAAVFTRGHCLLVGVPGLAKTLIVSSLAKILDLSFKRIQFTPDLMPTDILGTNVLEEDENNRRSFRFVQGPVFTNLLLADEINRTSPKTQAALLQAMQERAVTASGRTFELARPFLVFATQNPIEQEGTYPLPEAQQDRFMFSIPVGYPTTEEEEEIVRRTTVGDLPSAEAVLSTEDLVDMQQLLRRLPANPEVVRYCVRLASATRPEEGRSDATRWIRWGAGPRASQYLAVAARTWAALRGHEVPTEEDVRAIAAPVLRHRVLLNFEAEAAGRTVDQVIDQIIEEVG